jgi:hypothetical protein
MHVPFDTAGEVMDVPGRILSVRDAFASQVGYEGKVRYFVLLVDLESEGGPTT